MKDNPRAVIAYIAGRLINKISKSAVYDYYQSRYISVNESIESNRVNVYDYDESCHITGYGNNGIFNLYHYGNSHHINLKIDGNSFTGYDYGSSCHFSGKINGNAISIYDYGNSSYYNYTL